MNWNVWLEEEPFVGNTPPAEGRLLTKPPTVHCPTVTQPLSAPALSVAAALTILAPTKAVLKRILRRSVSVEPDTVTELPPANTSQRVLPLDRTLFTPGWEKNQELGESL